MCAWCGYGHSDMHGKGQLTGYMEDRQSGAPVVAVHIDTQPLDDKAGQQHFQLAVHQHNRLRPFQSGIDGDQAYLPNSYDQPDADADNDSAQDSGRIGEPLFTSEDNQGSSPRDGDDDVHCIEIYPNADRGDRQDNEGSGIQRR